MIVNLPILAYCLLFVFILSLGCRDGTSTRHGDTERDTSIPSVWFEECTSEWGVVFNHSIGEFGNYFMPEVNGSGAAIFDFDNDGLLDIYLVQNGGPPDAGPKQDRPANQLFRQVSTGEFENVSKSSGTNIRGCGMGVVAGDLDNDGYNDLFVTEYRAIRLLMNNQDGTFREVTLSAGLANEKWGTSASFVDYDRDGWLDIVVANYVEYEPTRECFDAAGVQEYCGPSGFPPSIPRLFRNLGGESPSSNGESFKQLKFEDVTVASGLAAVPGPGLGVVTADFNGDRWQDIFFADDAEANRLWINNQDGTFDEQAMTRGIAFNAMGQTQANMGIAIGDADSNGLFDIFVTHLNTETHSLWKQEPQGLFQDASSAMEVTRTKWRGTGFGTLFGDFNHNGFLDLAIANGAIKRASGRPLVSELGKQLSPYAERNQLLSNTGKGKFVDRSTTERDFCQIPAVSRGLACADVDDDGALDLLVTNLGGPAKIYRNVCQNRGHWLIVRAILPNFGGRDAFGATITVEAGDFRAVRILNPSYSFLSSSDARCHFGLGSNSSVSSIRIVWPDGEEEEFEGPKVDQAITISQGTGKAHNKP